MPTSLPATVAGAQDPLRAGACVYQSAVVPTTVTLGFCPPALRSVILLPALSRPSYMHISEDRCSLSWGPSLVE